MRAAMPLKRPYHPSYEGCHGSEELPLNALWDTLLTAAIPPVDALDQAKLAIDRGEGEKAVHHVIKYLPNTCQMSRL